MKLTQDKKQLSTISLFSDIYHIKNQLKCFFHLKSIKCDELKLNVSFACICDFHHGI